MRIAYKVWLENEGKSFGEGPYKLLKGVERTGSLHRAAADTKMSYQKAWTIIRRCEERLGFQLLVRKVGGVSGGGSTITPSGQEFLRQYESFRVELKDVLQDLYQKHFGRNENI
jgi:molybdate transport system regulatory protein